MLPASSFDVVVIGSGSAGFSAAEAARAAGAKVAIIEREKLGGECPNWACVPSKALLKAAKTFRSGTQEDFKRIMAYRAGVVEAITGGGEKGDRYERLAKKLGIELIYGSAAFTEANVLDVGGRAIFAKAFVIATGTVERIPDVPGLADIHYLTSKAAVMLDRQPKAIAIIGGGPVGCEFATFFSAIGTRVVLLQHAATVLNREDAEIAKIAEEQLAARGVEIVTRAEISEIVDGRGGVYGVRAAEAGGEGKMHAVEQVLVAAGKRANVDGLGLNAAGVKVDARGNIVTEARQKTSASHVFAAGDVDGGLMFTHTAHHEGSVAGHNAALFALGKKGANKRSDERVVPRVTFVDPEVASVGMTEDEVRQQFKKALVGRYPIAALGRAVTEHTRFGLVKLVAHPKTREVLGCHIVAERAGEMIHEAALAMQLHAKADAIASMIHAYPTYSEGLAAAANSMEVT